MVTDDVDTKQLIASAGLQERKQKPLKNRLTDMKRGFWEVSEFLWTETEYTHSPRWWMNAIPPTASRRKAAEI